MRKKELPPKKSDLKAKVNLQEKGSIVFISQEGSIGMKASSDSLSCDAAWYQVKQIEEELLTQHLLPFLMDNIVSEASLLWAVISFFPDKDYIQTLHEELGDDFLLWLLFDWVGKDSLFKAARVINKPIASIYLAIYPHRLSSKQKKWIRAISKTYYSFYVIMAVLPKYQLRLKDILLGTEYVVKDFHAHSFLKAGDIIWSRILTFDGQLLCVGMGSYVIPARYHFALLEYRRWWEKEPEGELMSANNLRKYKETNGLYFDILGKQLNINNEPSLSSDGEPFAVCYVYFLLHGEIEEVFKKLLPFAQPEYAFLEKKRDRQGRLQWFRFYLYGKGAKQTVRMWAYKGEVTIYRKKLRIQVTSQALAAEFQSFVEQILGLYVIYQKTETVAVERGYSSIHSFMRKYQEVEVNVADHPNFDAYLKSLGEIHWTYWLDDPEFALDGLTAREAAQTEEGRKQLDVLLGTFEDQNKRRPSDLTRPNANFIKKQLGLA